MTCAVKDLSQSDRKLLGVGGGSRVARATVKQILEKVRARLIQDKEDESLVRYKQALLGNLGQIEEEEGKLEVNQTHWLISQKSR